MKPKRQVDRVRDALHRYGSVTNIDFLAPNVIDGGPPITRLAARIRDLQDEGVRVVSKRLMNGARYELQDRAFGVAQHRSNHTPAVPQDCPPAAAPPRAPDTLFDLPRERKHDQEAA